MGRKEAEVNTVYSGSPVGDQGEERKGVLSVKGDRKEAENHVDIGI